MPEKKKHRTIIEAAVEAVLQAGKAGTSGNFLSELPFPDIDAREFWDRVSPEYRREELRAAEEKQKEPWALLLASDYLEFSRNGNREHFEEKYFSRRLKLCTLVLSECMENQGRFLPDILDGMYLILEESGWCLPAHNSYIRDSAQLPLQDGSRPVLDLFAAETGAILGLCEQLLRPRLKSISPFISSLVSERLRERILEPYLNYHFWWMGDGVSPMLNWTPWITQNVLLAVFTRGEEEQFSYPEEFRKREESAREEGINSEARTSVLRQAALSLDYFLDEYGEDGCCSEGAEYFSHAGLCLFGAVDVLNRLSRGGMASVFKEPLIYNMGDYIVNMYVSDGRYFNFADCSPYAGSRNGRDYLFAHSTGNAAYREFAYGDCQKTGYAPSGEDKNGRLLLGEENLYYHLLQLEAEQMMEREKLEDKEKKTLSASGEKRKGDVFYRSVGLFLTRDSHFNLAVKAGNNGDAHNHNDTGSFTLYRDGKPVFIDLGVETYTKKTFSPERYEIWTMQSKYHNLPTFYLGNESETEIQQRDGENYAAENVEYRFGEKESSISMELAHAYPGDSIKSYRRKVSLRKNDSISIEDHYSGSSACVLSLISYEEPKISEKNDGTFQIGDTTIHCQGVSKIQKEKLPITDPRLHRAWKHDCWRLLLSMEDEAISLQIE